MVDPVVGPGGAAFGIYPSAGRRTVRPRVGPLDRTYTGAPAQPDLAPRVRPQLEPPPAEMREYPPTNRERAAASAQETLQGLGIDRAGARRIAQSTVGGASSNLPFGMGLVDLMLLPSIPFLAEEGYRGTERAMSAAQRGDYGTAAMEYLGAATMMAPGVAVAPGVAREVQKVVGKAAADTMRIGSGTRQSQRGIFLSPKFFTPQEKARISTAERLEREGTSPDEVLVQTGLLRDLDGTWAVEISDDKMKFKALEAVKKARQSVVDRISDIEAAQYIRTSMDAGSSAEDALAAYSTATGRTPSSKATQLAKSKTLEQLEANLENANSSLMAPIRGLRLKDAVEHPELFDRIPELAEIQLDFVPEQVLGKNAMGGYAPGKSGELGTLSLRSSLIPSELEPELRATAGHELQHAATNAGGRFAGASPALLSYADEVTGFVGPRSPEEQMSRYMSAEDEVRARVSEARLNLPAEARLQQFPFRQGPRGMDMPEENVRSMYDLSGGVYGTPRAMRQRGAIDLGPRPVPLSEALASQPTTLRVLENLPGKRTTVTADELREQMRRPEVTKAEKDVLERVLSRMEGGQYQRREPRARGGAGDRPLPPHSRRHG